MHQIFGSPGLCPGPAGGAYSAPPGPLAGFRGKGPQERNGESGGKGRGREKGGEGEADEGERKGEGGTCSMGSMGDTRP